MSKENDTKWVSIRGQCPMCGETYIRVRVKGEDAEFFCPECEHTWEVGGVKW